MTQTFLVIYRPGPAWIEGRPMAEQPLKEHGKYMLELYQVGQLHSAGPFTDDSGGAAVLQASDESEVRDLVNRDPAVADGVFVYELRPWRLIPWESYLKK